MLPSDTIEGAIQDAIRNAVYDRADLKPGPYSLRFSSAGDCPRLLDYKLKFGRKEFDTTSAARVLTGEPIHEYYRGVFARAFGDDYTNIEGELFLDIGETRILGHCDGFLKSQNCVVEIKTVGSFTYEKVRSAGEPLPAHYAQANAYAAALGAGHILLLYHNRDSGEHLVYMVPYVAELWQSVVDKFTAALARKASGEIHPRPYSDASASPCAFCDYKSECYEGFGEEIAGLGEKEPSVETKLACEAYLREREARLTQERVEDKFKAAMVTAMLGDGLNVIRMPTAIVSLTTGKNNNILVKIKETK